MSKYSDIKKDIEKIISSSLENMDWDKPFISCSNLSTKKEYKGSNTIVLNYEIQQRNLKSPYFLTFNQIKKMKGKLKKGSKGIKVVYYQFTEKMVKEDEKEEKKGFCLVKYYTVFSLDDVEDIEVPEIKPVSENEVTSKMKEYIKRENINYEEKPNGCHYTPATDTINIQHSKDQNGYVETLVHETVHSTGSKNRLNRDKDTGNKLSKKYAIEELVAEFGVYQLAKDNEKIKKNATIYIKDWFKRVENIKDAVKAWGQANKAINFIYQS